MCAPSGLLEYFLISGTLWSGNSQGWIFGDTNKTICFNPVWLLPFSPLFLVVLCFNKFKVVLSCEGEYTAIRIDNTSMKKKLGGERLLIVSPFHEPEAVRALCGSGSQWRTRALVHKKTQCIKQLGLKGKAAQCYKLLFHVLLSLRLPVSITLSYSFSSARFLLLLCGGFFSVCCFFFIK